MKKLFALSFLFLIATACNNTDKEVESTTPEDDLDAARSFIRASLDGKLDDAKSLMLQDSVNLQYFNVFERNYSNWPADEKRMHRESSINIHKHLLENDSTGILIYSNSYKNNHDTLKIVRKDGVWKVDLKYLFDHPADTAKAANPVTAKPDSLNK